MRFFAFTRADACARASAHASARASAHTRAHACAGTFADANAGTHADANTGARALSAGTHTSTRLSARPNPHTSTPHQCPISAPQRTAMPIAPPPPHHSPRVAV